MSTHQSLRWLWGGASHQGARSEQQDRWGVFPTPNREGLLAVVADGMGGHRDGALGAQVVIDVTADFVQKQVDRLYKDPVQALVALCHQAQQAITEVSSVAHSTLVVLWLWQDRGYWMHVGDTRLYHLREGHRLLRTRDHSAAQLLVELGEISEAEMVDHPDQNRLYRSLGGDETPRPEMGNGEVASGDLLALCSDGTWGQITEAELWNAVQTEDLTAAATALVQQAAIRGGSQADNATLILIRPSRAGSNGWSWLHRLFGGKKYG